MAQDERAIVESLRRSDARRAAIMRRFGFVPTSVVDVRRGALSRKAPTRGSDALSEWTDLFVKFYAPIAGSVFLDLFPSDARATIAKLHGLRYATLDDEGATGGFSFTSANTNGSPTRAALADVAARALPRFERGARLVLHVCDEVERGAFRMLHAEAIDAFRAAGWTLLDVWILARATPRSEQSLRAPRAHEFALSFRAGEPERAKRSGVARASVPADQAIATIQAHLSPDLLHSKLRERFASHPRPFGGLCYVATEALFHALGGYDCGLRVFRIEEHEGFDHWFLRQRDGTILDPTVAQFERVPPYDSARGASFRTRVPSKRAQTLLDRTGLLRAEELDPTVEPWGPPPLVFECDGYTVVSDAHIPGGTKARFTHSLFEDADEVVYASPAQGGAQVALAATAARLGKRATIFVAKRAELLEPTRIAAEFGAKIEEVPMGYLSHCAARAREYCERTGAKLAPFGFRIPGAESAIATVARALPVDPEQVWCAASSGVLARGLARAWTPSASLVAVQVGRTLAAHDVANARIVRVAQSYASRGPSTPFSCNPYYEAKAWAALRSERPGGRVLFWNVISASGRPEQSPSH